MDLADAALSFAAVIERRNRSLARQLERSAASVPSNIAEGYGRFSRAEYSRFLSIAFGSLREVETQVLLARRRQPHCADQADAVLSLADETGRILYGLRRKLAEKQMRRAE